jgi:hypothetical protein
MFGEDRLVGLLATGDGTPDGTIATVRDAVTTWYGKDDPDDDQTVVVVTRR